MTEYTKINSVARVADELFEAEKSIESAINHISGIIGGLYNIRVCGSYSVFHGQDCLVKTGTLLTQLVGARGLSGELHKSLEAAARQAAIVISEFGVIPKPPHESIAHQDPLISASISD